MVTFTATYIILRNDLVPKSGDQEKDHGGYGHESLGGNRECFTINDTSCCVFI